MTVRSLSVIMPNYNLARYIGEALQSVLEQSFKPKEIIVVDDASTDNSVEIIEQFARRDPIISLVCNERNQGGIASVNQALQMASGDYVCFVSSDDRALPGLFEKSMLLLAEYPQAVSCCSDCVFFNTDINLLRTLRFHLSDKPRYFTPKQFFHIVMKRFYTPISPHTCITKRAALLEAGGFLPELRWACDLFANTVIGFRYGICYIPEPLAAVRLRHESYSSRGLRDFKAQLEITDTMIALLEQASYRDVKLKFQRTAAMSVLPVQLLIAVLRKRKNWGYFSLRLAKFALHYLLARKFLTFIAPTPVKRFYRRLREGREMTSLPS